MLNSPNRVAAVTVVVDVRVDVPVVEVQVVGVERIVDGTLRLCPATDVLGGVASEAAAVLLFFPTSYIRTHSL